MPTIFCKCDECNHFDYFLLNHRLNYLFNLDYQKMYILTKCNLPTEIAIKIVKLSQTYSQCVRCPIKLCESHTNRARENGGMCSQCCWDEIG